MRRRSTLVREALAEVAPLPPMARVLEVGSGAHGLIFFFDAPTAIGCDPLAVEYATLFPAWQQRARTLAACGEALPFGDASFDVVLCDNVVDHAEDPRAIVCEMTRVLRPGGLLYFTVNVHHPLYDVASRLHAAWNALGLHLEIAPFADHLTHLTPARARRLFDRLPLQSLFERCDIGEARAAARQARPRHPGDRLKRICYKNAQFVVIARRDDGSRTAPPAG